MINIDILELAKWAAALTAVGGLIFGIGRPVAKLWESTVDGNVWEPGVHGWVEVPED